jgi:hypothetical protein
MTSLIPQPMISRAERSRSPNPTDIFAFPIAIENIELLAEHSRMADQYDAIQSLVKILRGTTSSSRPTTQIIS